MYWSSAVICDPNGPTLTRDYWPPCHLAEGVCLPFGYTRLGSFIVIYAPLLFSSTLRLTLWNCFFSPATEMLSSVCDGEGSLDSVYGNMLLTGTLWQSRCLERHQLCPLCVLRQSCTGYRTGAVYVIYGIFMFVRGTFLPMGETERQRCGWMVTRYF